MNRAQAIPRIGCVQHDCAECERRKRDGWISVLERLPREHPRRCYLVVYKGSAHGTPRHSRRRVIFAIYSGAAWRFMGPQKDTRLSERVTHWMKKPRPPREQSTGAQR
jgi:hypothetical protein